MPCCCQGAKVKMDRMVVDHSEGIKRGNSFTGYIQNTLQKCILPAPGALLGSRWCRGVPIKVAIECK